MLGMDGISQSQVGMRLRSESPEKGRNALISEVDLGGLWSSVVSRKRMDYSLLTRGSPPVSLLNRQGGMRSSAKVEKWTDNPK